MKPDDYVTLKDELAEQKAKTARLELELAALRAKLDPPRVRVEPVQPLPAVGATERIAMANMRMSREVQAPMEQAFPEELAREVRNDRYAQAPTSVLAGVDAGPARMPATGAVRKLKSGYQG